MVAGIPNTNRLSICFLYLKTPVGGGGDNVKRYSFTFRFDRVHTYEVGGL